MSVAEQSRFVVDAVLIGKAVPFTRAGSVSAIAKTPVSGPQRVTRLGIADDEQGETARHGGRGHGVEWARPVAEDQPDAGERPRRPAGHDRELVADGDLGLGERRCWA